MPKNFDRAEFLSVHESIREQLGAEHCSPLVADTYLRLLELLEASTRDGAESWDQVVKLANGQTVAVAVALALGAILGALACWIVIG